MPCLPNSKHERFAQEIAAGNSASKAYVTAGYKEHRHNAAGLARKEHIKARISELLDEREEIARKSTQKAVETLSHTKEDILRQLWDNAQRALENGQINASNRALELYGKAAHGMFVERMEVGKPGDFEEMSDTQLLAFIAESAARLRPEDLN
jgi:phage terminase small subunit